jgi:hypothetical protein
MVAKVQPSDHRTIVVLDTAHTHNPTVRSLEAVTRIGALLDVIYVKYSLHHPAKALNVLGQIPCIVRAA